MVHDVFAAIVRIFTKLIRGLTNIFSRVLCQHNLLPICYCLRTFSGGGSYQTDPHIKDARIQRSVLWDNWDNYLGVCRTMCSPRLILKMGEKPKIRWC